MSISAFHKCPYCGSKYKFKEIIPISGRKKECKKCKKTFALKKLYSRLIFGLVCGSLAWINYRIMRSTNDLTNQTIVTIVITEFLLLFAVFVLSRYFIIFSPMKKTAEKEKKDKKQ